MATFLGVVGRAMSAGRDGDDLCIEFFRRPSSSSFDVYSPCSSFFLGFFKGASQVQVNQTLMWASDLEEPFPVAPPSWWDE